jgi:hypothetical protein
VEVFFPVTEEERDALVAGTFRGAALYGLERIAWEETGAEHDAIWVAAEVDDGLAERHEDPESRHLGHRAFTFRGELLNAFDWRVVDADEVAEARSGDTARTNVAGERGDRADDVGGLGAG